MRLPIIASLIAATLQMPPAAGQAAVAEPQLSAAQIQERVAQSSALGSLIYAFDGAAWVSTDALMAAIPKDQLPTSGGYVVEIVDGATLRVTYYRGSAADARAFFVADVRDSKVVGQQVLPQPVALSADQTRLVRAREIAIDDARKRAYPACTSASFNVVALPSGSGQIAVYLLTAQTTVETYAMGGNYRVLIAQDGRIVESRPFSKTCINVPQAKKDAKSKPAGIYVSHLLDPVPTEIHAFTSYSLKLPVYVSTPDQRMWTVQGSRISLVPPK